MNEPARLVPPEQTDFRARFTAAEFVRMGETGAFDDMRMELVGGELTRTPPPMNEHGRHQVAIAVRLAALVDHRRLRGGTGIELGDDTVLACDVALLHAPVTGHRLLQPDEVLLAVEIALTTLARDMGFKRTAYAGAGVPHYWVVDGERRVVHLFADPVAGDYASIASIRFGDPVPVPGCDRTIAID